MKKAFRIKKNEEFSKVFNEGKSVANRQFVLYALHKEGQNHFRIGLSVSKRIGNAVMRNRIKRAMREWFHQYEDKLLQDKDYVVIARNPTAEMDFFEMEKSLIHVSKKAGVLLKDNKR
ncbi:ribonuclease P protein component [Alkalihalobacterium alkalinitrilicum]|uniref:ribonuclease P protein component n=1 Tax=Alkalihalobacterium alkalinitrilicum TaxID=427920 RepID=UPI000995661C|nr:ribonuclease P protein component [Alkalihalobacterium alkalinitrilicum]